MASKSKPRKLTLSRNPTPEEISRVGIRMPMGSQRMEKEAPGDVQSAQEEAGESAMKQREEMAAAMRARNANGPLKRLRAKRGGGGQGPVMGGMP